jgi:hypothetical protein
LNEILIWYFHLVHPGNLGIDTILLSNFQWYFSIGDFNNKKENGHFGDLGVCRGIILIQILKKRDMRSVDWIHVVQVRDQCRNLVNREKPPSFIKGGEISYQLSEYSSLRKVSSPWSYYTNIMADIVYCLGYSWHKRRFGNRRFEGVLWILMLS